MEIIKEQVEQWCEENNHVLIDKKTISDDILPEYIVKRIAIKATMCNPQKLNTKYRGEREVFCRWLIWDYFVKNSFYSLAKIGAMFGRDHATVIHMRENIDNASMLGWRKSNRLKFESEINDMHEKLDLKKAFK